MLSLCPIDKNIKSFCHFLTEFMLFFSEPSQNKNFKKQKSKSMGLSSNNSDDNLHKNLRSEIIKKTKVASK